MMIWFSVLFWCSSYVQLKKKEKKDWIYNALQVIIYNSTIKFDHSFEN